MAGMIDLRSDTVTKPSASMLDAMFHAEVGDDVYGEDPSVNKLEQAVSALLGFESAMFTPSGTMANQIAIHLHTRHGDSVLTEDDSHVFLYEAGAAAAQSGVQFDLIPLTDNWSDQAITRKIKLEWLHYATTKLIVVENTHNRGSGRVVTPTTIKRIKHHAEQNGLSLHCDGARLWNAAIALGCPERDLASEFDSVSVCFSKGLGAPMGSALVGKKSFIEKARKVRKRWGGGMRQAGYMAAAALYAINHNRSRLADDHSLLRQLFDGIVAMGNEGLNIKTELPAISTNILYFNVNNGDLLTNILKEYSILVSHLGHGRIRAVTHMHLTEEDILKTISCLRNTLKKGDFRTH